MPTLRVIDGPRAGEYVTVDDDVTYPIVLPNPGTSYPFTGAYDESAPTPRLSRSTRYWRWDKARESVLKVTPQPVPMELIERLFSRGRRGR